MTRLGTDSNIKSTLKLFKEHGERFQVIKERGTVIVYDREEPGTKAFSAMRRSPNSWVCHFNSNYFPD